MKMTEENEESEMAPEWIKWMDAFEKDDINGKLNALNYLLIKLIDSNFEQETTLNRLEQTIAINAREIQVAKRGWIV